jgi:hypothetical protein
VSVVIDGEVTVPRKTESREAALIDLLINRAPAMRAAGILNFSIADCSVSLAELPPAPLPAVKPTNTAVPGYPSPLDDPSTYNLGGKVPGYKKPRREDPDDPDLD